MEKPQIRSDGFDAFAHSQLLALEIRKIRSDPFDAFAHS